ncbi:hypothetical protein NFF89_02710 [Proteus mirabilis]|uniref:hypothetical protein n=1 Tax=Proteus mirabilis TaxID=584 RepID=UPI0023F6FBF4|nr:hypothetical protein [Proteus mirabilis]MDF7212110.1 hypothetical protein [Proteus mirabilis]MDF7395039.1 hypothetical protein [Proteus mirabilis]
MESEFKVGDKVFPLIDDSSWIAQDEPCVIIGIDTTSICIENNEGFVDYYQPDELELINE